MTAPRRILIVDDAEDARGILAIALGTIGGAVVNTADSAEAALESIAADGVDVLITDVRMSGMSGLELLGALRQRGLWPSCGAVVISGETDRDLGERASASGAAYYFSKPFSAGVVRKAVMALLEGCSGE